MRISDWSSDVCSSDLAAAGPDPWLAGVGARIYGRDRAPVGGFPPRDPVASRLRLFGKADGRQMERRAYRGRVGRADARDRLRPLFRAGRRRSEEHTSELQSLMRISYAVFCLKKKKKKPSYTHKQKQ